MSEKPSMSIEGQGTSSAALVQLVFQLSIIGANTSNNNKISHDAFRPRKHQSLQYEFRPRRTSVNSTRSAVELKIEWTIASFDSLHATITFYILCRIETNTTTMNISVLSYKFSGFKNLPLGRKAFLSPDSAVSALEPRRRWTKSAWAQDHHGNNYRIRLCPDDLPDGSGDGEAMVSFSVDVEEREGGGRRGAMTKFSVVLRDADGMKSEERTIESSHISFDFKGFIERRWVLDEENKILAGGALHVDLIVQPEANVACSLASSQNALVTNMLKLLENGDMADVFFTFPDDRRCQAHKFVLGVNARHILQLFDDTDTIPIQNTTPDIFRCVLRYVYGGAPEKDFVLEHALDLIDAANYFGVVGLKLEAEALLVASRNITVENVVKHILFADARGCALLKEHAVSVFTARLIDVMKSESFSELAGSTELMRELMIPIADWGGMHPIDGDDLKTMPVVALREKLKEKGLDVDGSKELLISRLERLD